MYNVRVWTVRNTVRRQRVRDAVRIQGNSWEYAVLYVMKRKVSYATVKWVTLDTYFNVWRLKEIDFDIKRN